MISPGFSTSTVIRDGKVADDTPCHHCGYNLRTLGVGEVCPECGTAVKLSLRGSYLAYADPGFLRRIVRGTRLIVYACILLIVACVLTSLTHEPILEGAAPILIGLSLWGVFLITAPDPSAIGEAVYARYRWPARILLIIGPTTFMVGIIPWPAPLLAFRGAVDFATCAAGTVGFVYLARYLHALALRIPADDLAESLKQSAVVIAAAITILTVANAIYYLSPRSIQTAKPWLPLFGCSFFALIGTAIRLAFAIRRLGLLVKMSLSMAELIQTSAKPNQESK